MSCVSGWTRCVKKKTWQAFQIDVFVSAMSHVNEKETCITIFHIPTSQSRSRPRRTFEPQQTSIWQSNEMTSQQSAQKQKGKNDHIIALTTTARLVFFALCMCFSHDVFTTSYLQPCGSAPRQTTPRQVVPRPATQTSILYILLVAHTFSLLSVIIGPHHTQSCGCRDHWPEIGWTWCVRK